MSIIQTVFLLNDIFSAFEYLNNTCFHMLFHTQYNIMPTGFRIKYSDEGDALSLISRLCFFVIPDEGGSKIGTICILKHNSFR